MGAPLQVLLCRLHHLLRRADNDTVSQHQKCVGYGFLGRARGVKREGVERGGEKGGATNISLRINLHLWHGVVVLHVLLPYVAAIANGLDTFTETVRAYGSEIDGSLGDERDGCSGIEGLEQEECQLDQSTLSSYVVLWRKMAYREHGTHDDRLHRWNRGVRITLEQNVSEHAQLLVGEP